MCEWRITRLLPEHAAQVAQLHIIGVSEGFITSLGIDFVTSLYQAMAKSEFFFGFVAEKDNKVLGFAAFTISLSSLYKSVILNNALKFAFILAWKMFSLSTIKKIFETLCYPGRIKKLNLPSAEFLSVVVAEEGRGQGLAKKMMQAGFDECVARGIDRIKILAAINYDAVNKMYEKCGFQLFGQIDNHGIKSNVYVVPTNHFEKA